MEELIAFIRARNDTHYEVETVDPTDATRTVTLELSGWRDPGYALPAEATPVPACWTDQFATPATPAPSAPASAAPSAGAEPTAVPGGSDAVTLTLTASGVQFDVKSLEAPADAPFKINFVNNDGGIPHNVAIHKDSPTGAEVWKGEIFNGVATKVYEVPALPAGTYGFVCTVHPNMFGTLTVK